MIGKQRLTHWIEELATLSTLRKDSFGTNKVLKILHYMEYMNSYQFRQMKGLSVPDTLVSFS